MNDQSQVDTELLGLTRLITPGPPVEVDTLIGWLRQAYEASR